MDCTVGCLGDDTKRCHPQLLWSGLCQIYLGQRVCSARASEEANVLVGLAAKQFKKILDDTIYPSFNVPVKGISRSFLTHSRCCFSQMKTCQKTRNGARTVIVIGNTRGFRGTGSPALIRLSLLSTGFLLLCTPSCL